MNARLKLLVALACSVICGYGYSNNHLETGESFDSSHSSQQNRDSVNVPKYVTERQKHLYEDISETLRELVGGSSSEERRYRNDLSRPKDSFHSKVEDEINEKKTTLYHAILKTLKDFLVLSDSNNNNNDENGDESLDDAEVYKTLDSHRRFESLDARVYGTRVIGKKEIR